VSSARGWSLAAAVLAVAALGLPWSGQLPGASSPSRVAVVAGLALAVGGLRTGRDRLLTAALGAALVGVLLGGVDGSPGRVALAASAACLALACLAAGRRLLPGRRVRSSAG
jgi:hypothetical protein